MLSLAILIVCALLCLASGVLALLRNPKAKVNRLFSLLAFAAIGFSITNYLSLASDERLLYIRLVTIFSTIAVSLLYYLIVFLCRSEAKLSLWQKTGIGVALFVLVLDCTPWVFSGLNPGPNPTPIPSFGAFVFIGQLFVFLLIGLVTLFRTIRHSVGRKRQQLTYLLVGITPLLLGAPTTGFIVAVLFNKADYVLLDSVYATFLAVLVGYSIVKHRLFDIRLIVARALAYVVTLALVAALYGFVVLGVAQLAFGIDLSFGVQFFLAAATGLAALTFQHFRNYFNKATDAVFYRDAYDANELFNKLNEVLVSTLEIEKLMSKSTAVIKDALKPSYLIVSLSNADSDRVFGDHGIDFSQNTAERVWQLASRGRQKMVIADFIDDPALSELKELMADNDMAVLIRLDGDSHHSDDSLGFIVLGDKSSGNPYTVQDARVLDAVANELIVAIQNSLRFEEIQRFNETLQGKIHNATSELRRTNERLKQLDETKDDFISMASHQLRTPLTSVKGYLSMVLDGDAGKVNSLQRKMLGQALTSSQRMVYLIADLLNVSRLKTGKFTIDPTPVNLADMITEEIDQLKQTAASHDLELIYEAPKTFPDLMLDETKTRQVIMNFIDNAIYYTKAGGKIVIKLTEDAANVELRVIDNGIGVPASERHHLFTKFYRAKNAQKARPDGTGIGLFMAKKVIVGEGGTIIFETEENKGSTFGFALNKAKLLVKPEPVTNVHTTDKKGTKQPAS